ncbi:CaiB/BaiF CoA-transferase family protein [Chitinivorax sp. B]|uniref:CaiB/BaiF CoA transferase family protein n=1 Tax=Chitinivorax sp. B TaxID=2502235 RepID=UPI0010F62EA5|nr:CaiB/BaiF CoA-transferase family protein [Chitinivorax sp. B]
MPGPLSNLKVLDFSTLLPGPYATLMLADLGADVLRIESPTRPDLARILPPHADGDTTANAYLNRNKRSLALDLKSDEVLPLIHRLLAEYDILVEQFRPGVMARLGLGYEALRAINPRLIYCSITGYGQTGPLKDRAGHDINYLALSGIASYTGRQQSGPLPLGVQLADVAGGSLHAVIGILAAVNHRNQTGEGQHIDISMTDCAFALNALAGAGALAANQQPHLESDMLNGGSFYDYYQTADHRWLAVGSLEPQFMQQLATALVLPDIAQHSLSPDPNVQAHIKHQLRTAFRQHTLEHWHSVFNQLDACVEPVLTFDEARQQPHAQARGWVVQVPTGQQSQSQLACPIKFSTTHASYRFVGRSLGADSQAILCEQPITNG